MNMQLLAYIVEDMNKALYKTLPDVEGVHLRYYNNSFWLICWEDMALINTMWDNLQHLHSVPGQAVDYTQQDIKNLIAERFAKVYAEKLQDKLKEDVNVSQC